MDIADSARDAGARLFDIDPAALQPLGGMDGAVYGFERGSASYILKIAPVETGKLDAITAKLHFVNYLAQGGVRIAKPITSINDRQLEIIAAESDRHSWAVTASERAPGGLAVQVGEWKDELFALWGKTIGQMHRLTKAYDAARDWADGLIGDWQAEHAFFARWIQDDAVRARWLEIGATLNTYTPDINCFGLIHNDLHPHNFMVHRANGELQLTVFDFDVCNYHWFMTDIGIALYHALWTPRPPAESAGAFARRFMLHFMRGYSSENALSDEWLARLPVFLKYRRGLLYPVMLSEWREPNDRKRQYLAEWRQAIINDTLPVDMTEP